MALITSFPSTSSRAKKSTRTVGRHYQSVIIMLLISLFLLGGIGSRLAYLQLVQGPRNRELADNNRILLLPKRPARGTIYDRNGQILAGSRLSHAVSIWPIALPEEERDAVVQKLSEILDIPEADLHARLEQAGYESTQSVPIARGISPAQVVALAMGMNDEELQSKLEDGYRLGDFIGQMGAESAFEPQLRGGWGGQQVEVDSAGRVVRILGQKPSESGQDVQLTLDLELQKVAEAALGDRTGAIIDMDPRDGAILAMVSRPTFDPNIFSTQITDEQWQQLQGRTHPFLNRALRAYPPASTFKIVTTTAAIESGTFSPSTVLATYPYVQAGGILFWDWNKAGFGPLSFAGAMAWSSDTFFYQVAMRMGEAPLIEWTRRYGFGSKTGFELAPEESEGLVPDHAWKKEALDDIWYQGDTINMSIGQGYMLGTPLQVTVMFAIAANGGYKVTPHILKDDTGAPPPKEDIGMSDETIRILEQGLRQVATGCTGTVVNIATLPPISGKSGTAEADPYENHTWFGAFGPTDNPEIIVLSFGEHSGGGGGSTAGPLTRQVIEAYFNQKQVAQEP